MQEKWLDLVVCTFVNEESQFWTNIVYIQYEPTVCKVLVSLLKKFWYKMQHNYNLDTNLKRQVYTYTNNEICYKVNVYMMWFSSRPHDCQWFEVKGIGMTEWPGTKPGCAPPEHRLLVMGGTSHSHTTQWLDQLIGSHLMVTWWVRQKVSQVSSDTAVTFTFIYPWDFTDLR